MSKPFKLVYVEWEDALGCSSNWSSLSEAVAPEDIGPPLARSVGWLCQESSKSITVVPHFMAETKYSKPQGCGDMTIPRSAIRKIVSLKPPGTRKKDAAHKQLLARKTKREEWPPQ